MNEKRPVYFSIFLYHSLRNFVSANAGRPCVLTCSLIWIMCVHCAGSALGASFTVACVPSMVMICSPSILSLLSGTPPSAPRRGRRVNTPRAHTRTNKHTRTNLLLAYTQAHLHHTPVKFTLLHTHKLITSDTHTNLHTHWWLWIHTPT